MESDQLYKRKPYKKDSADVKSLLRIKKSLVLTKGILFRKNYTDNTSSKKIIWQLVVPKAHRHKAILGCHDDIGHQGRVRTLSLLRERFFWPGMQVEATQHIAKCPRCLKRKSTPHVAPLQPILVSQPLELVHLDYLTLEPSKGNIENVLVITDHFTRYALAYASKTQTAQATTRILWDNFICHYGFPEQFISDQGRNFESDLIQELCKIAGVKKLHTTPYHPQSNGQCERFNSTLCNMLGTLSDEEKSDWKSHLGCMTHAYNCTKHVSTTYSPHYLMFGRHPRLPIDVEIGLHKPNCSDNCSKSRYIQKLRRRLNYAHKKAGKYSSEQAQKYKTSYDKSVKGPQLQVNDLVLVKIVAHKARHKIQDKWESEEYIVLEQPIPGTRVYRVRPVTGTKVRTLHRNLLLPLGVKYQPDIDSDESDSDDSVHVDTSHSKSSQPEKADSQTSQAKSVKFQSELPKVGLEDGKINVSQADPSSVERVNTDSHIPPIESVSRVPDNESGFDDSTGTGEHMIPQDVDLPSQYLVTHSDGSSAKEDTTITELNVDSQVNKSNTEDDLPFIDSRNDSLVDTNEFLEFVDTLDTGEQTADIVPKSVTESQFSSVMSYHEGDSTPLMDPSTDSQELSKSLDVEGAGELASGTVDHEDSSSHDIDVFASDNEESSLQSIQNDSSVQPTDSNVTQSVVEDEPENVVSVEVSEPRRSGRVRKQTALYGNPLLYTITYKLTPRFVPAFFNKMSETLESLHTNYLKDSNYDDNS